MWFQLKAWMSRFRNPFSQSDAITKLDQRLAQKLNAEEVNEQEVRKRLEELERDLDQLTDEYEQMLEKEVAEREQLLSLTNRIIENEELEILYDVREALSASEQYGEEVEELLDDVLEAAMHHVENEIGYLNDMNVTFKQFSQNYRGLDSITENIQRRANYKRKIDKKIRELRNNGGEDTVKELCQYCKERIKVAGELTALATVVQKKIMQQTQEDDETLSEAEIQERRQVEDRLEQFERADRADMREEQKAGKTVRKQLRREYNRADHGGEEETAKERAERLEQQLPELKQRVLDLPDNPVENDLETCREAVQDLQNVWEELADNKYSRKNSSDEVLQVSDSVTKHCKKGSFAKLQSSLARLKDAIRTDSKNPVTDQLKEVVPHNAEAENYRDFKSELDTARTRVGKPTIRRRLEELERKFSDYREPFLPLLPYYVTQEEVGMDDICELISGYQDGVHTILRMIPRSASMPDIMKLLQVGLQLYHIGQYDSANECLRGVLQEVGDTLPTFKIEESEKQTVTERHKEGLILYVAHCPDVGVYTAAQLLSQFDHDVTDSLRALPERFGTFKITTLLLLSIELHNHGYGTSKAAVLRKLVHEVHERGEHPIEKEYNSASRIPGLYRETFQLFSRYDIPFETVVRVLFEVQAAYNNIYQAFMLYKLRDMPLVEAYEDRKKINHVVTPEFEFLETILSVYDVTWKTLLEELRDRSDNWSFVLMHTGTVEVRKEILRLAHEKSMPFRDAISLLMTGYMCGNIGAYIIPFLLKLHVDIESFYGKPLRSLQSHNVSPYLDKETYTFIRHTEEEYGIDYTRLRKRFDDTEQLKTAVKSWNLRESSAENRARLVRRAVEEGMHGEEILLYLGTCNHWEGLLLMHECDVVSIKRGLQLLRDTGSMQEFLIRLFDQQGELTSAVQKTLEEQLAMNTELGYTRFMQLISRLHVFLKEHDEFNEEHVLKHAAILLRYLRYRKLERIDDREHDLKREILIIENLYKSFLQKTGGEHVSLQQFGEYVKSKEQQDVLGEYTEDDLVYVPGEDDPRVYRIGDITPDGYVLEEEDRDSTRGPLEAGEIADYNEPEEWTSIASIREKGFLIFHCTGADMRNKSEFYKNWKQNMLNCLEHEGEFAPPCASIHPDYLPSLPHTVGTVPAGIVLRSGTIYKAYWRDGKTKPKQSENGVVQEHRTEIKNHTYESSVPRALRGTSMHNELIPKDWEVGGLYYVPELDDDKKKEVVNILKNWKNKGKDLLLYVINPDEKTWKAYDYNAEGNSFEPVE